MGRGLSALQKMALRLALEMRDREPEYIDTCFGTFSQWAGPHLLVCELLVNYYKLQPRRPDRWDNGRYRPRCGGGGRFKMHRRHYWDDPPTTTSEAYNRAVAATSRALKRLVQRGLLIVWQKGESFGQARYSLSDEGSAVAESLMVKEYALARKA